ncbi:DUF523 domain-containing protein [Campylobacter sp. RM16192]|uniref:DUF523 domain-containing protein n=1 Tax=Campylobacter sp. RM16192 TaxID=1660080 RepID=UPI001452A496|nr:DUF523 domain-containing protein [Campylobacter sp. RM16192]QCD53419.1 putative protein (DUF523 domain) [Campylobacter sp. RM16192]
MKEKILVSACLLGINCKYNGSSNQTKELERKFKHLALNYEILSVCPEELGGLATPREVAEINGEKVFTKSGKDVTEQFSKGAKICADLALKNGCKFAVLKSKSPSCGSEFIYDGTFSKTLKTGDGFTARALKQLGVKILDENFSLDDEINLII